MSVGYSIAENVLEPGERAGGAEHDPHRVPRAGRGVTEHVDARLPVGLVGRQHGEDDPRGAEHDRDAPRAHDADPDRSCRLVAGAADHRRLEHGRQPVERDLELAAHLFRPAPLRDVEEERPRRVGGVGQRARRAAGSRRSPSGAARARSGRRSSGSCSPQPEQLRCGEARERTVAGQLRSGARGRSAPRSRRTAPPVRWSFQSIAGRRTASSPPSTTSPCICPERPSSPSGSAARQARAARHPVLGVLLGPAGLRRRERVAPRWPSRAPRRRARSRSPLTPEVPTSRPTSVMRRARRTRARRRRPRPCAAAPRAAPAPSIFAATESMKRHCSTERLTAADGVLGVRVEVEAEPLAACRRTLRGAARPQARASP